MRFADRRKLVCLALFYGAGCLCALKSQVPYWVWLALAVVPLARFIFRRPRGACLLLACAVFLGGAWAAYKNERPDARAATNVSVQGTICAQPITDEMTASTILTLEDVKLGGRAFEARVRLYVNGAAEAGAYKYGARVSASGAKTWIPDGVTNPDGFDFAAYLWRDGVALCASCKSDAISLGEAARTYTARLMEFRDKLGAAIDVMFPENSDVMRALALGDRSNVDEEVYGDFKTLGIAHLLALSGLHVSCLALFIEWILRLICVPRRLSALIVVALLCVYARMTGARPSIIRAVLMFAMLKAHRACGYPGDMLTRLAAAFLLQLMWNPLDLLDAGFQLSYTAVLGLALINPTLSSAQKRGRNPLKRLKDYALSIVRASASIQLSSAPIMCSQFFALPVLGVVINVFAIPLALISLYLCVPALALFAIWPWAGRVMAHIPDEAWTMLKRLTDFAADVPFAAWPARVWPLVVGAAYMALMAFVSAYGPLGGKKRAAGLVALIATFMIMLVPFGVFDKGLTLCFLDAGYADSAIVHADGRAYMIDCGRDNTIAADALSASGKPLGGVFLTHPDIDHAGGVREVLKRNPRATVYLPECWPDMNISDGVRGALEGARVVYLKRGDVVRLSEDIYCEILWPEAGFTPEDDNDGSLVLNIVYGEASALFMGDLTSEHDQGILRDCDVLKVSHHGSKYATSERLLGAVTPACAIVSVSGNAHGHPTPEVLARLERARASVYRTDAHGAITVTMYTDGSMDISTILDPEEADNALATVF